MGVICQSKLCITTYNDPHQTHIFPHNQFHLLAPRASSSLQSYIMIQQAMFLQRMGVKSMAVGNKRSVRCNRGILQVRAEAQAEVKEPKPVKVSKFCAGLPGNTSPGGNFDPLNFLDGKDDNTIRRYREAELTHGRVSMLASVGFIVAENFNPLFGGEIKGPAINHFQQLPSFFWVAVLAVVGGLELSRATKGWVNPGDGKGIFLLKDDYIPGDIGWDPLGIKPETKEEFDIMQNRELNNGRLAMFAIAGDIAQELATGKELFNLEDDKLLIDANCGGGICDILESSG